MDVRKKLGFFRTLGVWGEVRTLEAALVKGEAVQAVGIGKGNGQGGLLAATDQRLLWVRMDGMAPALTVIDYQNIKACVPTNGLVNGCLEINGWGGRLVVEQLDLRFARELRYAIDERRRAV